MPLLPSGRACLRRQARALHTLDDILTEHGGVQLPPLRWTIEPNSTLTGHVPPLASEDEIHQVFTAWVDLLDLTRLHEHREGDRTIVRAVAQRYGLFHVYLTVQATVPDVLTDQERELVTA